MGKYNTERKHKEGQEMYKAVYHFILKYYRKHHYMPSTRNIADGLDISMATARKHFNLLLDNGLLVSEDPTEQRAYRLSFSKVKTDV